MPRCADTARSRRSASRAEFPVRQALLLQGLAHAVDIEPELARLQPLAVPGLLLLPRMAGLQHGFRPFACDHDHAVVVSHDDVAGSDQLSGTDKRDVY